jgi:asparagine synthetase B (glutamine-hydrolysing)
MHGSPVVVHILTPPPVSIRNSEIYNHEELKERYLKGVQIVKHSKSDSAIIGHLYEVRDAFDH